MEPTRDDQLIADLRALRPTPHPGFTAELDHRAAAGFPRRSRVRLPSFHRLRALPRRRLLLPAGAIAVLAIAAVAAVISTGGTDTSEENGLGLLNLTTPGGQESAPSAAPPADATAEEATEAGSAAGSAEGLAEAPRLTRHREVERSAEIVLGAAPEDVADDTGKVFEGVHANRGIVLRSSTEEGPAGEAGATFELLIPSAKLGDAMAAFSEIDEVRSRHEATADITAPTVTAAELLKESRARIDSLLAQLEAAETEEEREAVEAELRHERRHASRLAAQLDHLHRRADFSRVSLRIETGSDGESSGGGGWGINDALDDAGHVLTVAAAVTLIGLAVLGPIVLIALLAWLTHRAWLRRERRRALG